MSESLRESLQQRNQEIIDSAHLLMQLNGEEFTPYRPEQLEAEKQQSLRLGANVVTLSGSERAIRTYDTRLQTGVSVVEVVSLEQRIDLSDMVPYGGHSLVMTWQNNPAVEAQINLVDERVQLVWQRENSAALRWINLSNHKSPRWRARILGGLAAATDTLLGF